MHPALTEIDHRPWPLPSGEWKWRQSWLDLAFLHYPVATKEIESRIPKGVSIDTYENAAWIGLVPFRMSGVMRRPLPDIPLFSSFPELNLRTYVIAEGKPGVWFFSLDAASYPIVLGGKALYDLPYHYANSSLNQKEDWFEFLSIRKKERTKFHAKYRPIGEEFLAKNGTFEHWATERYCLYSLSGHLSISRVEVHHKQWPLQKSEVDIVENEIIDSAGISVIDNKPRCHYSRGVHVISYGKQRCQQNSILNAR